MYVCVFVVYCFCQREQTRTKEEKIQQKRNIRLNFPFKKTGKNLRTTRAVFRRRFFVCFIPLKEKYIGEKEKPKRPLMDDES